MDRNGNRSLTRPATPQAFRVTRDCGVYSFITPRSDSGVEEVPLPAHLRSQKVTVREMPAARR